MFCLWFTSEFILVAVINKEVHPLKNCPKYHKILVRTYTEHSMSAKCRTQNDTAINYHHARRRFSLQPCCRMGVNVIKRQKYVFFSFFTLEVGMRPSTFLSQFYRSGAQPGWWS